MFNYINLLNDTKIGDLHISIINNLLSNLKEGLSQSFSKYFQDEIYPIPTPFVSANLGINVTISPYGNPNRAKNFLKKEFYDKTMRDGLIYVYERSNNLYNNLRPLLENLSEDFTSEEKKELSQLLYLKSPINAVGISDIKGISKIDKNLKNPKIFLSGEIDSFYYLLFIFSHEATHLQLYQHYPKNQIYPPIIETTCDLLGLKISQDFIDKNLDLNTKNKIAKGLEKSKIINLAKKEVVKQYYQNSIFDRINDRKNILENLEQLYLGEVGETININESVIHIWQTYSGDCELEEMLICLEKCLGPTNFLKTIPILKDKQDLEKKLSDLL